jgi:hypothetical protein
MSKRIGLSEHSEATKLTELRPPTRPINDVLILVRELALLRRNWRANRRSRRPVASTVDVPPPLRGGAT